MSLLFVAFHFIQCNLRTEPYCPLARRPLLPITLDCTQYIHTAVFILKSLPPRGGIFRIKSPFEGGLRGDVENANIMRDIQNENCCNTYKVIDNNSGSGTLSTHLFSGRGGIPHRRYPGFTPGSPRALPSIRREASRSGVKPEPTVRVRMEEDKAVSTHLRHRFRCNAVRAC